MLLKCCQPEKKTKGPGNTQKRSTVNTMRATSTPEAGPRVARKAVRSIAVKRSNRAVKEEPTVDPVCDNSNDSGLGFEQHQEYQVRFVDWPGDRLGVSPDQGWVNESPEAKRKRLEIKIESDDANDNFTFPDSVRQRTQTLLASPPYRAVEQITVPSGQRPTKRHTQSNLSTTHVFSIHKDGKPVRSRTLGPNVLTSQLLGLSKSRGKTVPSLVTNQMSATSRDGKTQLVIISQPEQQHRARYQTEGSRGAVKDRSGNGFPQVQLSGWAGPATLEVYIGSDCGKVVPHMFYQACRVSGKNSSQCQERTDDGTVVIEIPFEPSKDMTVTCDCVGILKERNVDVEHRFPDQSGPRNKKKSTRCRMVFRTFLTHLDGSQEMLQICSQPIACTQPPGVPEICKKSLTSSPACGGLELFILGKNFLKDTRVLFTNSELQPPWEVSVTPDKEYLQQAHLVCVVPPYQSVNITEPVTVRLTVVSSDKSSEAHCFTYTPQSSVGTADAEIHSTKIIHQEANPSGGVSEGMVRSTHADSLGRSSTPGAALNGGASPTDRVDPLFPPQSLQYLHVDSKQGGDKESIFPLVLWKTGGSDGTKLMSMSSKARDVKLFSLPAVRKNLHLVKTPALVPLLSRRPMSDVKAEDGERTTTTAEQGMLSSTKLKGIDLSVKTTVGDGSPGPAVPMATGADLSSTQSPSMDTLRRFIANDNGLQLPSLNVEKFLSHLEQKSENSKNGVKDLPSEVSSKLVNSKSVTSQPEFVPLETLMVRNIPLSGQAQIVPSFQQLSEEKIVSASVEPSIGVNINPCTRNSVSTVHYRPQVTSTSVEQNDNVTVMSGANLLQKVNHEQMKFLSKSPEPNEFQETIPITNHFLSQDVASSSPISCTSVGGNTSPQQGTGDGTLQSQLVGSVGNIAVHKQPSDLLSITNYEKAESTSTLQSNNTSNSVHDAFATYVVESGNDNSLHSPPLGCKGDLVSIQDSIFSNFKDGVNLETSSIKCNNLQLGSQNPVSVNNFIAESSRTSLISSSPVQLSNITEPVSAQMLSELGNNNTSLNLPSSPIVAEESRSIQSQDSQSVGNGYILRDIPSISCTSPIVVNNMLVHSQDTTLYDNYMQENVLPMAVGHPQMPKKKNAVMKDSNDFAKCQILENASSNSIHVSTDNMLNMNASTPENVFDIKDEVVTTASSLLVSNEHTKMCSPNLTPMYSFSGGSVITDPACSSQVNCISSPNTRQPGNNEHSSSNEKLEAALSVSPISAKEYIAHAHDTLVNTLPEPVVSGPFTTCLSVDAGVMGSSLSKGLQDSMVTNSACSLPPTISNILEENNHLTALSNGTLNVSGCSATSIVHGQNVDNIPTSLNMSTVLLRTPVTLNDSHVSSQCPTITMKDLLLNNGMLVTEKTVSATCLPVDSSVSVVTRPTLAYSKVCSEPASQGLLLSAGMSTTEHEQLISQPQAITPETVTLDALVNSTLDSHVQSTQSTTGAKLEVAGAGEVQNPTTTKFSNSVDSTSTSTLLHNIFSLNSGAKNAHVECFVAATIHSDISRCVQHPNTNSSQCSQLNSTEMSTHSNNGNFQCEQSTQSNVGFAVMPSNTQFNVTPGISFTSSADSLHFTNVSTNSTGLNHFIDMQEQHAKVEEKAKHKDGVVVRERREEGMLSQELTQMSDHDLISYINPSCFDQV